MDNVEYIATRLKARREALGLSQFALAELVGTSQSAISEWESSKASGIGVRSVERWAKALGFTLHCELNDVFDEPIEAVAEYQRRMLATIRGGASS